MRKKTKVPKQDSQNLLRWPIFFIGTKNISSTFLSRKIEFLHCVLFLFLFVVFLYVWFRFENNIFNRKKPYIGHWRSKHNILTWKHLFNLKRKVHKSLSVRAWRTSDSTSSWQCPIFRPFTISSGNVRKNNPKTISWNLVTKIYVCKIITFYKKSLKISMG